MVRQVIIHEIKFYDKFIFLVDFSQLIQNFHYKEAQKMINFRVTHTVKFCLKLWLTGSVGFGKDPKKCSNEF